MARRVVRRHALWLRVVHWVNVLCLTVLLASGLQIFNAHRALYWGDRSDFAHPLLALPGGFPPWLILPSYQDLATGRVWHFFFAWILVINGALYVAIGLLTRHIRRDLLPDRLQWRGIGRSLGDHLRLRLPRGEAALRYNVLQKLSYLVVMFGLLPLMVATGITMSPAVDTAWPWLLDVFGGRQSARTIHFACAWLLVLFTAAHVAMVLLAGPLNEMRSIVTGRFAIRTDQSESET